MTPTARADAQPTTRENPFFAPSTLPFEAPPFDRIQDADYQPAIEEGMRRHLAEVEAIARTAHAPTFDNTIVALERSGELLTRVLKAFGGVTGAHTNDALQAVQTEVAPKLAAHSDAIFLNECLFKRVQSIYDHRDALDFDREQRQLVERYHLEFVRAGARLSESDKTRLRALNQEESTLTTDFQNRLLAAMKAGALVIDDPADLEGLSAADIAAAAEAAAERQLAGKWLLRLQNTTQQPAQESLRRRAVRRRLYEAAIHRADRGDSNDTRAIIRRLAELRAERAKLLGYETAAAYILDDQMAKTPQAAEALLTDIGTASVAKVRDQAATMQVLADRDGGGFKLSPWDW